MGYTFGNVSSRFWQTPQRSGNQHGSAKSFDKLASLGPADKAFWIEACSFLSCVKVVYLCFDHVAIGIYVIYAGCRAMVDAYGEEYVMLLALCICQNKIIEGFGGKSDVLQPSSTRFLIACAGHAHDGDAMVLLVVG